MGYELTGLSWSIPAFKDYIQGLNLSWVKGITMHHTAHPSLADRPHGFTAEHLENLEHHYKTIKGWKAGPHLFIDDNQIWGLSSLEKPGTHAVGFNSTHIGIEVLGDYDREDLLLGRGQRCWKLAIKAVAELCMAIPQDIEINGHRDDPTTNKTCPGSKVDLQEFRMAVGDHIVDSAVVPKFTEISKNLLRERIQAIEWQIKKLKEQCGL